MVYCQQDSCSKNGHQWEKIDTPDQKSGSATGYIQKEPALPDALLNAGQTK